MIYFTTIKIGNAGSQPKDLMAERVFFSALQKHPVAILTNRLSIRAIDPAVTPLGRAFARRHRLSNGQLRIRCALPRGWPEHYSAPKGLSPLSTSHQAGALVVKYRISGLNTDASSKVMALTEATSSASDCTMICVPHLPQK